MPRVDCLRARELSAIDIDIYLFRLQGVDDHKAENIRKEIVTQPSRLDPIIQNSDHDPAIEQMLEEVSQMATSAIGLHF